MLQRSYPAIRKEVHDTLKQYSQRSYICHCLKGVGAFQLGIGDLISEHDNFVVVDARILEPAMFMKFSHRCDCTCKYVQGQLKINRDIWMTNLKSAPEIRAALCCGTFTMSAFILIPLMHWQFWCQSEFCRLMTAKFFPMAKFVQGALVVGLMQQQHARRKEL